MAAQFEVVNLNGSWSARAANETEEFPAQVPGCVHEDLIRSGRIEEPFYRDREVEQLWIGQTSWIYRRTFPVPARFRRFRVQRLECEGLDTLATIRINGREVARTDNMFRRWEFDVREFLQEGENVIEVEFAETLSYIRQKAEEYQEQGRRLYTASHVAHAPKDGTGAIRRALCNYGWDWGPVFPTCGIWKPMRLTGFDSARFGPVQIRQAHSGGEVRLTLFPEIEFALPVAELQITAELRAQDGTLAARTEQRIANGDGISLDVLEPRLWWPNGLGEPHLYSLTLRLRDAAGNELDQWEGKIGLREIRLCRTPDEEGETFGFTVNGKPFFASGSNWIPPDAIYSRAKADWYEHLLKGAAEANQNMIRVWGGGLDEYDAFFDACDRLGLCVWMDFNFACTHVPLHDEGFISNFLEEARQKIKRLRHRACLALWCGNNEFEMDCVAENSPGLMRWEDYEALFDEKLPALVQELDPEHDYWPASPHSPLGDRTDYNSEASGDAHLWYVWAKSAPVSSFLDSRHRFISEFGMQAWPHPKTLAEFFAPEDCDVKSRIANLHQRARAGNGRLDEYIVQLFDAPRSWEEMIWLSQFMQADALTTSLVHWRMLYPRTEGALYWQLNDTWPGPSWSTIDYRGRWKAGHYAVKRAFAPAVLQATVREGRHVEISLATGTESPAEGELIWRWWNLDGAVVDSGLLEVEAASPGVYSITTLDAAAVVDRYTRENLLLQLLWVGADGDRASIAVPLLPPKRLRLADPEPSVEWTAGGLQAEMRVKRPALWLWIEDEDARLIFSDNFIACFPDELVRMHVTGTTDGTIPRAGSPLSVRSLWGFSRANACG